MRDPISVADKAKSCRKATNTEFLSDIPCMSHFFLRIIKHIRKETSRRIIENELDKRTKAYLSLFPIILALTNSRPKSQHHDTMSIDFKTSTRLIDTNDNTVKTKSGYHMFS